LPQLVSEKKLRPPPIMLEEGGWDGILTGLDKLRAGKVSGGKIVVKLESEKGDASHCSL
jgi:hypothetical protein